MCHVLALLCCACVTPRTTPRSDGDRAPTVRVLVENRVVGVPLEKYVRTVVLSEFAPVGSDAVAIEQMLELQAIVTRTYALNSRHGADGYDMCSTTHCQLYDPARTADSRWSRAADEAAVRTAGVVVWFGNTPARVVYHADCGGRTSAGHEVWEGRDLSYLVGVADQDVAATHARWQFAPETAELRAALNADGRTRVGAFLNRIDVVRRDSAGRAQLVALDGERSPVISGEEFRTLVSRAFGPRAVRSTWFDVVRTTHGFEFTGRGLGHGVGLCQKGAYARIAAGGTPAEILMHYFPGTSVH